MVIIITGASHTGKTLVSQKLLEKLKIPYLSLDHLKMGLIRSKHTDLTVYDDTELTPFLWKVAKEIIKTIIENKQNIIIEGCYVPFDWQKDFDKYYLEEIHCFCLKMTERYISENFGEILVNSCAIENRVDDFIDMNFVLSENKKYYDRHKSSGAHCIFIDTRFDVKMIVDAIAEKILQ